MFYELFSFMNQTLEEIEQEFDVVNNMDDELALLEKYLSIKEMNEEIEYELQQLNHKIKKFEKEHGLDLDLSNEGKKEDELEPLMDKVESVINTKESKVDMEEPEVVIEIDEDDFMNFQKGIGFFDLWMYDQATVYLEKVVEKYPDFSLARLYSAMAYYKKKDYQQTKAEVVTLFKFSDDPDLLSLGHNLLGMIAGIEKNDEQAIIHFQQAITLKPKWNEPKFNLAIVNYRIQQYQQAIIALTDLYRDNPLDWEVTFYLGKAFQRLGEDQHAQYWLNQTYSITKHPVVIQQIAKNFEDKGEYRQAAFWYEKWLKQDINNQQALIKLSKSTWLAGNKERGLALIEKLLNQNKDNFEANFLYALMLLDQNTPQLAIDQIEQQIDMDNSDMNQFYLLAVLARLYHLNRDQKRSEQFCSLLMSSKQSWVRGLAHITKGFILIEENEPKQALEHFQSAEQEGVKFPHLNFYKGYCHYLMGNNQLAKDAWKKLALKGPKI